MTEIKLPAITKRTLPTLESLTKALSVPRDILASDDEIEAAWINMPRVLKKIPPQLRTEGLARMCVAVASGLFDSAINYAWNSAIIELRQKVRKFGLNVVRQAVGRTDFDEQALLDLKDAELLDLCLKLNLITEDGFFFLDQCRDIRNNFSAAHPAVGKIDDSEFLAFVNRCAKYALGDEKNPVGVDIQAFVAAIKDSRFSREQRDQWVDRLRRTHEAQRELLFGTLHGIYSDPASSQDARLNALSVSRQFANEFTPTVQSELIDRHQDYLAKGDTVRHTASQQFFEKLSLLGLLSEGERHALISNACKKLFSVHQAFDNFYNEPPFAERLAQLTNQGAIPGTVKPELVETIVTCAVGNPYGISRAAYPYYQRVIEAFTPAEIDIMLLLPKSKTIVGNRIRSETKCKDGFRRIVSLVDPSSVPTRSKKVYEDWI
ncbi:conserved hypothetical protein [uncultured Desulfobacterium sp.]|uniref:Uncharacterized protein n=1 Tax=uncultured Desulfobacterium sp. TaxID=201089 RepID=A0A445MVG6_9BACT|nr:conserved hypothetical protein [uncultured Desulfobacterium sp.]